MVANINFIQYYSIAIHISLEDVGTQVWTQLDMDSIINQVGKECPFQDFSGWLHGITGNSFRSPLASLANRSERSQ